MAENTHTPEENAVVARESAPVPAETRESERYLVPAVDIYEEEEALTLIADVPGVGQDGLDIRVEEGILTIKASTDYELREGAYYSEFGLMNYWRQFRLSDEVDAEKISAALSNGVLTLRMPKAEKAKPKKIEVKID